MPSRTRPPSSPPDNRAWRAANGVGKAGDNVVGGGHHVDMVGDINLTGDNNGVAPRAPPSGRKSPRPSSRKSS